MRIISPYHDYYDSAQGYGIDPSLIYHRRPAKRFFERWTLDPLLPKLLQQARGRDVPKLVMIGFCGRAYPAWLPPEAPLDPDQLGAYSPEQIALKEADVIAAFELQAKRFYPRNHPRLIQHIRQIMVTQRAISTDIFRELDCPVFIAASWRWSWDPSVEVVTNPRLANLGFQKVMDAFAAYQEIAMFLGTMLTGKDSAPRTVGGDKIVAQSKGFDEQSFRTSAPGAKKLNRKANRERKRNAAEEQGP